jgi:hypothetical protein
MWVEVAGGDLAMLESGWVLTVVLVVFLRLRRSTNSSDGGT